MNEASWIALGLFAVAAPLDWWAVAARNKAVEYVTKPLALVALVIFVAVSDPSIEGLRAWWIAALLLSLAGDVFLMLPRDLFLFGLVSFLFAHLAYVGGFVFESSFEFSVVIPLVVLAGVAAVLLRRMLAGPGMHPKLRIPVVVYVGVITVMVACAIATASVLPAVGALLFMGSDALIGWRRFVAESGWMAVAIIVLYHLGQLGLTLFLVL